MNFSESLNAQCGGVQIGFIGGLARRGVVSLMPRLQAHRCRSALGEHPGGSRVPRFLPGHDVHVRPWPGPLSSSEFSHFFLIVIEILPDSGED